MSMSERLRRRGPLLALVTSLLLAAQAGAQDAGQLERSCAGGDPVACATLALLSEVGGPVAQDLDRAAALYERACDGAAAQGCAGLALMYEVGRGVNRDVARALELYRQGCSGGHLTACDRLAALGDTHASDADAIRFPRFGRVTEAESGRPLAEAIVEVGGEGIRVVSDEEGRVSLGRLPAGRYPIRAERFGYQVVRGEVVVPATEDFQVQLPLAELGDPTEPGRVIGRILDEGSRQGLANVEVSVHDASGVGTLSNARGSFTLSGLTPGLNEIGLARLGYAPRAVEVIVQPGGTVELTAEMSTEAIELAPIEVVVHSEWLERNGFYSRARRGLGRHFSRQDLDDLNLMLISDIGWRVPGVSVRHDTRGNARLVSRRGGECTLPVFVDGVPARYKAFDDLDDVLPHWLDGIEVYHGIQTPVEYGGVESCGAVVIWTVR